MPANNTILSTLTPLLDWDSVTSANSFRIRVSSDSTFATTQIDTNNLNVTKYQVPAGKLQNGVKYYWRVNASNSCQTSAWSATWNFRSALAPAAPNLVAPLNNSNISSLIPLFDWDSVTSANSFRIIISSDSLFATSIVDSAGITLTKYQIPSGKIQYGIRYFWKVNASNPYFTGPWSQAWNFMAALTNSGNLGSEIPKAYKLYDNYPNPFNPTTNIKFDLPANCMVKIKIYDVMGREVMNPVNGFTNAGSYEIQINASNLSSGIYFCRIEADYFTDVKRMLLIK
ncbi:MAG: T9SS type A sorting domain-containing protein [Bacteroidetes bacterium]|nr:T9SS type A sorting domain-containing protein [Bacteroidota bacterium]